MKKEMIKTKIAEMLTEQIKNKITSKLVEENLIIDYESKLITLKLPIVIVECIDAIMYKLNNPDSKLQ